jgi:hypothetical protein
MVVSIQYLGEVTYPGDYDIGLRVGSFDNDHLDHEPGLFRGATCLGVADAIGGRGELPAIRPAAPIGVAKRSRPEVLSYLPVVVSCSVSWSSRSRPPPCADRTP